MKKLNAKVSKKIVVIVLTAVAAFSLMGCTVEKTVTTTETHTDADGNTTGTTTTTTTTNKDGEVTTETTETAIDLVTYEFETFDNLKIVLDESNITAQEPSDDPEYSELVSEEARGNIIAPGRDFVYLEDANNYYVADYSRNLITVADKSKVQVEVVETTDDELAENPGVFDTDSWSISYDTEKWYGSMGGDGSVIINNLNAVAGTSLIEITEADVATVDEACAMLVDAKGKALTAPEKLEMNGNECYVVYDEAGNTAEGVYIFDFYLMYEHNGKVIIVDESITHDDDNERAELLSYEFDDVVQTLTLK